MYTHVHTVSTFAHLSWDAHFQSASAHLPLHETSTKQDAIHPKHQNMQSIHLLDRSSAVIICLVTCSRSLLLVFWGFGCCTRLLAAFRENVIQFKHVLHLLFSCKCSKECSNSSDNCSFHGKEMPLQKKCTVMAKKCCLFPRKCWTYLTMQHTYQKYYFSRAILQFRAKQLCYLLSLRSGTLLRRSVMYCARTY